MKHNIARVGVVCLVCCVLAILDIVMSLQSAVVCSACLHMQRASGFPSISDCRRLGDLLDIFLFVESAFQYT